MVPIDLERHKMDAVLFGKRPERTGIHLILEGATSLNVKEKHLL